MSGDLVLKPERLPSYPHVVEKSHTADKAQKAGPKFYWNVEKSKIQHEGNCVAEKRGDKNKLPVGIDYAEPRHRQVNLRTNRSCPHLRGFPLFGLLGSQLAPSLPFWGMRWSLWRAGVRLRETGRGGAKPKRTRSPFIAPCLLQRESFQLPRLVSRLTACP